MKNLLKQLDKIKGFFRSELANDVAFIKLGTEAEGMLRWHMPLLQSITGKEAVCKIGGPEARSDLFEIFALGITRFVAPMVESQFAVEKFIDAVEKTVGIESASELTLNIESIQAFKNLDEIMSAAKTNIHRINCGFTDLSQSMHYNVNDPYVLEMGKALKTRCRLIGKRFSFGGSISVSNIERRLDFLQPDFFETRLLVFPGDVKDPASIVGRGLEFEMLFENYLGSIQKMFVDTHESRAAGVAKRLVTLRPAA